MEWSLPKIIVLCLALIAIVAMFTGNDGQLLHDIVVFLGGLATAAASIVGEKLIKG